MSGDGELGGEVELVLGGHPDLLETSPPLARAPADGTFALLGVNPNTLAGWRWKLKKQATLEDPRPRAGFVRGFGRFSSVAEYARRELAELFKGDLWWLAEHTAYKYIAATWLEEGRITVVEDPGGDGIMPWCTLPTSCRFFPQTLR